MLTADGRCRCRGRSCRCRSRMPLPEVEPHPEPDLVAIDLDLFRAFQPGEVQVVELAGEVGGGQAEATGQDEFGAEFEEEPVEVVSETLVEDAVVVVVEKGGDIEVAWRSRP